MLPWRRAEVLLRVSAEQNCTFIGCSNQLIPRRLQTWMLSWIPLSGQASQVSHQVKDRPSFTSNTSPDYNRLPGTAEALIQGFVTSRHRILPEAPICPKSLSFLICSTPWLHPHPQPPPPLSTLLIPISFDSWTFFGFNFSYSSLNDHKCGTEDSDLGWWILLMKWQSAERCANDDWLEPLDKIAKKKKIISIFRHNPWFIGSASSERWH